MGVFHLKQELVFVAIKMSVGPRTHLLDLIGNKDSDLQSG